MKSVTVQNDGWIRYDQWSAGRVITGAVYVRVMREPDQYREFESITRHAMALAAMFNPVVTASQQKNML